MTQELGVSETQAGSDAAAHVPEAARRVGLASMLDLNGDGNPLDDILRGMNGRQLADEAQRRRPSLKVLFTTGDARNPIDHHGTLDAGVDDVAVA